MVEINFSSRQSDNFLCGLSPEENTQETLLSDLNLGLSLGRIYDGKFKERPFTRSFTGLISLNKDTVELGNMLSLEMSGSIPIEGEQEHGRKSKGGIIGEEKSPQVTPWIVASAERSPALNRALAQIKAAEGCKFWKRLRTHTNRKRDPLMGETSREINFSAETSDEHAEILLHRSSEKTKESQLSNQEQLESFDLNITPSLSDINDDNFKEKPLVQSSSVFNLIDLNKDSDDLSNTVSFARSCSIPTEREQYQRRAITPRHFQIETHNSLEKQRSGVSNFGKEKVYLETVQNGVYNFGKERVYLETARSGVYNFGKEKVSLETAWLPPSPSPPSRIATWAFSSVESNPALRRALSRIKEADECVYRKRLRIAY